MSRPFHLTACHQVILEHDYYYVYIFCVELLVRSIFAGLVASTIVMCLSYWNIGIITYSLASPVLDRINPCEMAKVFSRLNIIFNNLRTWPTYLLKDSKVPQILW